MRLFYAAFLSQENKLAYQALVDRVMSDAPGALRPIPPGSHHLTLAFLGEIADNDVDRCLKVLDSVQGTAAASFELEPPRILYGRGQPRLVHAALGEGADEVSRLQGLLCDELRRVLPALDLRPKPPHITLARFNRKANRQTAGKVEEALSRHFDSGQTLSDELSSVSLVKSSLTPSGPIYESLGKASLS